MSGSAQDAARPPDPGAGQASAGASAARWLSELFAVLYARSLGDQYGVEPAHFLRILAEIGARYLPSGAGQQEATSFYVSLRVEELALARGCVLGNEKAWEVFLTRYREKLYDAARAIAREDSIARELADSLYADLYGTDLREGQRVSKLASYTGRGSLEGWLRAVLAQEFVNRYRRQRRNVSLEEQQENGAQFAAPPPPPPGPPADLRLESAAAEALAALAAEDRFILASYYLDGRKLAEIGRMLGMHESTISRRVEKITGALRKRILRGLRERGMGRRQAEEALEADVRDLTVDVRQHLAQESPPAAFLQKKAGTDIR
jgi:RNA polymerase sigma-70 factor (ECF subfamily)